MINNYAPSYSTSHALVIGINKYEHVSPLSYAKNDAEAIKNILISKFNFKLEHITALYDEEATFKSIRRAYLNFTNTGTSYDDRLLVFFAGHGHTIPGRRGDIGYLVPHDGQTNDLASLIRWDDLTRNGDLINAKHILYIMDACYGGLALTRNLPVGSKRFLRDMLTRHARQVITAGKANEVVADSGGPRVGHSMFTGHLLDALDGNDSDTPVTANTAMSYVYHKVSGDSDSQQTPHFGFIDGDGDFVFDTDILEDIEGAEGTEHDLLISVAPFSPIQDAEPKSSTIDLVKEYLSEPRFKIKLDDVFSHELRVALAQISAVHTGLNREELTQQNFVERLRKYEQGTIQLRGICTLLARWGESKDQRELLRRIVAQLSPTDSQDGFTIWADLRWFPVMLVLYSAGVGAVAQSNYDMLEGLFAASVTNQWSSESKPLLELMLDRWRNICGTEFFKTLPGHEKHHVPDREYLFKLLQPSMEDLLFLGLDYEAAFDRFEVLMGLSYLSQTLERNERYGYALPGRYAYKSGNRSGNNPYMALLNEATTQGADWPPVRHGLFESIEAFQKVHALHKSFIDGLHW